MINLYFRRFFGFIIDSMIIISLISITRFFIPSIYNTLFFVLLYSFMVSIGYKSAGMKITKLQFGNDDCHYSKVRIFVREFIFKWGLFFLFPIFTGFFTDFYINHMLLILLVLFFTVNTFCFIIFKRTLPDILSKIKVSKINPVKQELIPKVKTNNSVLAFIIDFAVIYSITILLCRVLIHWIYVEIIPLLFTVALLYSSICYFVTKQTLGKSFAGISVVSKNAMNLGFRAILIREFVCKFLLRYGVFFIVLFYFGLNDMGYIAALSFILNVIIGFFYLIIKGEFWWDTFANTEKIKNGITKKGMMKNFAVLISIFATVYIFLLCDNNLNHHTDQNIAGFKYPFKKFEYPDNEKITPYNDYLKYNDLKSPKDYVLGLFENYDIVILCENLHGEDTQWNMIYDVVSDDYFIQHVGHVFTEYGCAKNQTKVNTFLNTAFENDTLLEKETATLMPYRGGSFYYFMKKLNILNQNLTDSLKIQEHFTDILSWRYLYGCYGDTLIENNNKNFGNRDSLMANVIIDWYGKTGKKCLVITNYRHAFALNNEAKSKNYYGSAFFSKNEAQYIYNQFPCKTANVYIYGHRYNYLYYEPVQKGKWKSAFKQNGYQPVGFDLKDTPFGKDYFDIFPTFGRKIFVKWQDIFTGMIFYKPDEFWTVTRCPYQEYAVQQEYKWAIENNLLVDTVAAKKVMEMYEKPDNSQLFWAYINLHDYIDILIFALISGITFLVSSVYMVRRFIRHS